LSARLFFSDEPTRREVAAAIAGFVAAFWVGLPGVVAFMGGLLGTGSPRWSRRLTVAFCAIVVAYVLTGPIARAVSRPVLLHDRARLESIVGAVRPTIRETGGVPRNDPVQSIARHAGYVSVIGNADYVMFVRGGFLDNVYGILCVLPDGRQPQPGDRTPDHLDLVSVAHLDGCWYRFVTT
jgi:hypothetical protein